MGACADAHNATLPETYFTYVNLTYAVVLASQFFYILRRVNRNNRRALAGVVDDQTITIGVYLFVVQAVLVWAICWGMYKTFSTSLSTQEDLCDCPVCPVSPGPPPSNGTVVDPSGPSVEPDGWIYHAIAQSVIEGASTGFEWSLFVLISSSSLGTNAIRRTQVVMAATLVVAFIASYATTYAGHQAGQIEQYSFSFAGAVAFMRAAVAAVMLFQSRRASARPALRDLALFLGAVGLLQGIASMLVADDDDFGTCLYDLSLLAYFSGLPFCVLRVCVVESFWWRTALQRTVSKPQWGVSDVERAADVPLSDTVINMNEMAHVRVVGAGANGTISQYGWRGQSVVLKSLHVAELNDEYLSEFAEEAGLLRSLKHPNVVAYIGVCVDPPQLGIVMELLGNGDLFQALGRARDEGEALQFEPVAVAIDVAMGMEYLHSRSPPIIHRDLKSMNVLLSEAWRAKLADFGEVVSAETASVDGFSTQRVHGTPAWSAPEVLQRGPISTKADVYSFGVLLWELLTFEEPFLFVFDELESEELFTVSTEESGGASHVPLMRSVVARRRCEVTNVGIALDLVVKRGLRPPIPEGCPRELARLLDDCWALDPAQRPTFEVVLKRLEALRDQFTGVPFSVRVGAGSARAFSMEDP